MGRCTGKVTGGWRAAIFLCIAALVLAGCRGAQQAGARADRAQRPRPAAAASSWPREAVDDLGRRVVLEKPPQRIVTLAPSMTEIVCALGAADRLVGITDFCDWPPEVQDRPRIGGIINPSVAAPVRVPIIIFSG